MGCIILGDGGHGRVSGSGASGWPSRDKPVSSSFRLSRCRSDEFLERNGSIYGPWYDTWRCPVHLWTSAEDRRVRDNRCKRKG